MDITLSQILVYIGKKDENDKKPKKVTIGTRHQNEENQKENQKESYVDVVRAGMMKRGEKETKNACKKKVEKVQNMKIDVSAEK